MSNHPKRSSSNSVGGAGGGAAGDAPASLPQPPPASDEEKGRRFLELIDKQSTIQQSITSKLMRLISEHGWDSDRLKSDLEGLIAEHADITREINGLDADAGGNR